MKIVSFKWCIIFISIILNFTIYTLASEQFNQIDAFTSASIYKSLKITQGKVYKNYAVITWSEDWDDEHKVIAYRLKWGTEPGVFTDSLDLKGYIAETENVDTLNSLKENTAYYGQFLRNYNNKLFLTDFLFNTPPLPTIPPVSIKNLNPAIINSNIVKTIERLDIYAASGKRVFSAAYTPGKDFSQGVASINVPGLYLAVFKNRNNNVISSRTLLINK